MDVDSQARLAGTASKERAAPLTTRWRFRPLSAQKSDFFFSLRLARSPRCRLMPELCKEGSQRKRTARVSTRWQSQAAACASDEAWISHAVLKDASQEAR
eukprot:6017495-Alexandrium_andersonii.AAC.1